MCEACFLQSRASPPQTTKGPNRQAPHNQRPPLLRQARALTGRRPTIKGLTKQPRAPVSLGIKTTYNCLERACGSLTASVWLWQECSTYFYLGFITLSNWIFSEAFRDASTRNTNQSPAPICCNCRSQHFLGWHSLIVALAAGNNYIDGKRH